MEKNIFKSTVSFLPIGFGLIGASFFFAISYYLSSGFTKPESSTNGDLIAFCILIGVFCFFGLLSLFMIFNIKTITLTNKNLVIERPLLFLKFVIPLENIQNIHEEDYEINSAANSRKITVYKGEKMTIEIQKGKKIVFTSFEISEYDDLAQYLKNIEFNITDNAIIKKDYSNKSKVYSWLLFIFILTIILIYQLLKSR
ncbi:hypothetical protein [Flavobacterium sp. MDT1-60]|uniref:hypothetical protein n=1 Tax=Flavobacterium sp. MDT1-60 TaxID=1979344 RepID=UPI001784F7B3|nr:hypothetical protein [Flavobacterium sp. MDT1-60]QOG02056.1 hypothetical protein IHE43_19985 [Flavobacterium sp. MDT1-60]